MRGKNTIIINGKVYDAVSGLPAGAPDVRPMAKPVAAKKPTRTFSDIGPGAILHRAAAAPRPVTPGTAVHNRVQKSVTLRRDVLKKPAPTAKHVGELRKKPAAGHVARSQMISKFAAHPQPIKHTIQSPARARALEAMPVSTHVARAHNLVKKPDVQKSERLSSRALKEKLITDKLAEAKEQQPEKRSFFKRQQKMSIVAGCFALIVLGGYMTYLNMPNLSVRVAASQAGVAAKFPDYRPDGYRFNGPIAYSSGEVTIRFQANGGQGGYTIRERSSSWDSQAVYDNLVAKESDGGHITNSQGGLTVYTFKNDAAWVNGGVLYTIDSEAPLSNEQLLRIAGSM